MAHLHRYTLDMAEPPDIADLAKRYLDLWQDQMMALAADPDFAESVARLLSAWTMPLSQAAVAFPFAMPPVGAAHEPGTKAAGAAPAAAPSDERAVGVDELAHRVGALEERLAALETGIRGARPSAPKRSRGRSA
jgi:hypothetical protein